MAERVGDRTDPVGAPRDVTTTTVYEPEDRGLEVLGATCAGRRLTTRSSEPISHPLLVEVSGIAIVESAGPDPEVRSWVVNDSGDLPRIYGIDADGDVQVVTVRGAENVDWEAVAEVAGPEPFLWIADTGANFERDVVQLYRVPVPRPGDTEVRAERVDVTYPFGSVDVEALLVERDGPLYLLTKELATSRILRVDPPEGGGRVRAELLGEFRPGAEATTTVTDADLSPDGDVVLIRTYGTVWAYPVVAEDPVTSLVSGMDTRCRGIASDESQGEAVAWLPDGSAYVTVGEGADPTLNRIEPSV